MQTNECFFYQVYTCAELRGFLFCLKIQGKRTNERRKKRKIQLVGLFQPRVLLPFAPPPPFSSSSPTSLHTLFLAPGIRTGRSGDPSLALPSQVSTPHAVPVGLPAGAVATAAAEGEALDTDQWHFPASLQVVRATLTEEEEEMPAP